ncbi:hypothetical protein [Rhodanobacter geophilus]|uniref:DUF1080 domain-containing protein n=1 Tax=Rhodanobacter geophilus TaxID=3162488 RepID=A0ABV3QLB7_9GAMM
MNAGSISSSSSASLPMAARWQVTGDVSFKQKEGFPSGLMVMSASKGHDEPQARLKGVGFENGTIEFDVKPIDDEWPTVRFRVHDASTAEEFYIRPEPDCSVAIDCVQYAPIIRGRMLWDSNYEYQHSAPFRDNEWNHVKLVISGRRMNVYINRLARPALVVGDLEGAGGAGCVELQGPAIFTDVVVAPGDIDGLSPKPLPDPTASDRGYLRHWRISGPYPLMAHAEPVTFGDLPNVRSAWLPIQAERLGVVNLARRMDPASDRKVPRYTWLKTTLHSERSQVKQVSLGYLRIVTVFVNGQPVFSGKNLYNTPSERKQPDGRLGLENGNFELPLKKGDNQIVVALRSNSPDMADHYGYGFRFHIDGPSGLNIGD